MLKLTDEQWELIWPGFPEEDWPDGQLYCFEWLQWQSRLLIRWKCARPAHLAWGSWQPPAILLRLL